MELELIEYYRKFNQELMDLNIKYSEEIEELRETVKIQEEKIKQLRDLSISLDRELTNITKEVNSIEL